MEEIFEQWTWRWLGLHEKPIAFLDTDGYWTPMLDAIAGMERRGIVRAAHRAIPIVERDPEALLDRLVGPRTEPSAALGDDERPSTRTTTR